MISRVAEHLAEHPIRVYDLTEFGIATLYQEESGLIHILVERVLVHVFLESLVHVSDLLHLCNILCMQVVTVQYVEVEIRKHEVEVAVSFVDPETYQVLKLILSLLNQLRRFDSTDEKLLDVNVLWVGEMCPEVVKLVSSLFIEIIEVLVMVVLSNDLVNVYKLVFLCLVQGRGLLDEVLLIELELCIVQDAKKILSLQPCEGLMSKILLPHDEELKVGFE